MRMWVAVVCMAALTLAAAPPPAPAPAAGGAPAATKPQTPPPSPVQPSTNPPTTSVAAKLKFKTVTLHVFHRAFANFHDQVEAKLNSEFRIGDSNYTGIVTDFVPDFTMDLKTKKVTTRSNVPNNPAVRIVVRQGGKAQDTTWAFLNMPPHFAKKSLIAFLATRVSFENHEPVLSRDSTALKLMQMEGR